MIVVIWIALCFLVALAGKDKVIGYWGTFFLSLILSPLIGLIIGLVSREKQALSTNLHSLSPQADKAFQSALKNCQKGNVGLAIEEMLSVIPLAPNNPKVYYNLACFYALSKNKVESFNYLAKSVEKGYSKFEQINSDKDLLWLREQPEYHEFSMNGYKSD